MSINPLMNEQRVAGYRSYRLSLRWLPEEAAEPTSTIVLTGSKNGVFVDTRFIKDPRYGELDWAIAGYRTTDPSNPNVITFRHLIDSRTLEEVEDMGTNSTLPDGTTLEVGEMTNPDTGKMTPFEEIWRDEEEVDAASVLFIKNIVGTSWQGRVGHAQMGLGRAEDGIFWAWQAEKEVDGEWEIRYSTQSLDQKNVAFLPEHGETSWEEGSNVEWAGDTWTVLERGDA